MLNSNSKSKLIIMKYFFVTVTLFFFSLSLSAQTIVGQWETYDDETNEKKGLIEIFENNGVYTAKVMEAYTGPPNSTCRFCEGDKKDQPIIGMEIIEGLEKDGDTYEGGTILDPESGKIYKCYLELEEPDKLKVRGYIGFALLGRTQYWRRK